MKWVTQLEMASFCDKNNIYIYDDTHPQSLCGFDRQAKALYTRIAKKDQTIIISSISNG